MSSFELHVLRKLLDDLCLNASLLCEHICIRVCNRGKKEKEKQVVFKKRIGKGRFLNTDTHTEAYACYDRAEGGAGGLEDRLRLRFVPVVATCVASGLPFAVSSAFGSTTGAAAGSGAKSTASPIFRIVAVANSGRVIRRLNSSTISGSIFSAARIMRCTRCGCRCALEAKLE